MDVTFYIDAAGNGTWDSRDGNRMKTGVQATRDYGGNLYCLWNVTIANVCRPQWPILTMRFIKWIICLFAELVLVPHSYLFITFIEQDLGR